MKINVVKIDKMTNSRYKETSEKADKRIRENQLKNTDAYNKAKSFYAKE